MQPKPPVADPPTLLKEIDGPDKCCMCDTEGLKTELWRDPFILALPGGQKYVQLIADVPVHSCTVCDIMYCSHPAQEEYQKVVDQYEKLNGITRTTKLAAMAKLNGMDAADKLMLTKEDDEAILLGSESYEEEDWC